MTVVGFGSTCKLFLLSPFDLCSSMFLCLCVRM